MVPAGVMYPVEILAFDGCEVPPDALRELELRQFVVGPSELILVFFERFAPGLTELVRDRVAVGVALNEAAERAATVPLLRAKALDVMYAGSAGWPDRILALLEQRRAI